MGFKSSLVKPYARKIRKEIKKWSANAVNEQEKVFAELTKIGSRTLFGKDHGFRPGMTYQEFSNQVPIRDYEGISNYISKIQQGQPDVLWKGHPSYFAKTSGTTSGVKYIPLTKDSLPNHFGTARNALFNYMITSKNNSFLDGKMIFLSGSPKLTETDKIPTGRLSGIVNHQVPAWLRTNQLPSYRTNCITDWEKKVNRIVHETHNKDLRLISGIPPWVQMYFERLLEKTGKSTIKEVFPNFSVFVYGGVNYEPYRDALEALIGGPVDTVETYPASEGFIAFQDDQNEKGLLLNSASGIFFEFVPVDEIFSADPTRLTLADVEINKDYAIIINSNAGLWGYNIGDTVRFVSKDPYRLLVTGRVKHFISAFGEHVIGKEVEEAILGVARERQVKIIEFTVAPQVNPGNGETPYHEWFVEFDNVPDDLEAFQAAVDQKMNEQNIYYRDLIAGKILQPLKIVPLKRDTFRSYMSSQGKLGGQNKVPRLSNDRKIADAIITYRLQENPTKG